MVVSLSLSGGPLRERQAKPISLLRGVSSNRSFPSRASGSTVGGAVELGGFAGVPGLERLVVLGQYGFERWDINSKTAVVPEPPAGLDAVRSQLPRLLEVLGLPDAPQGRAPPRSRSRRSLQRGLPCALQYYVRPTL